MSKSELSAYFREGYYLDIKRTDGVWTTGVVKAVDPVRGYNVCYEDNAKAIQIWFGKGSERIAPFRQACSGKELNSVLRKAGLGVKEAVLEVKAVLSRTGMDPMALVQAYRGDLLYRVLDLVELGTEAGKDLWQETLTQVVRFCVQWLQRHVQGTEVWLSLLKSKDAYLSSVERAEASCWPELFDVFGKALLVKFSSHYAVSSTLQREAFDLLCTTLNQLVIPFHMLGSYPVWDLFPLFGSSDQKRFIEMLEVAAAKPHFEPRYFDLSALTSLLEKLTPVVKQLQRGSDSKLNTLTLEIAKDLGRDKDRLEARIQSLRVYTLALERARQGKGLPETHLVEAFVEVTRSHLISETNTEAIALSFPLLSFLADRDRLTPEDMKALVRPQGHESVVTAKFQLATKLAPTLSPAVLSAVVEVWAVLRLSRPVISAMKDFTIHANSQHFRHPCFLPLFQQVLVRQDAERDAGEVLTALTDIVQLPAFHQTQSEMLASLASALPTSGVETIFSFAHLFRQCDREVKTGLQQTIPALLTHILDLALKHEQLSTKDCPPTVVLSTILALLLDVVRALGKECLSKERLLTLHRLIDPVVEERVEQYFDWLLRAVLDPQSCSQDLNDYCSRLLTGDLLPQSLYQVGGVKTISFFQRLFLERNSFYLQVSGDGIDAVVKKWGENYLLGLWTLFNLALQQRRPSVQERATAFILQLLFRSQAQVPSLLLPYLAHTFDILSTSDQSSALKSLLAVIEYYEQLSDPYDGHSGPLSVQLTWNGEITSLAFPQDAKLGQVRKALNRPYHTVALIWQQQWYSFIHDEYSLSTYGNPAYFTVREGDFYTHYDPIEALASGYATGLVNLLNTQHLQPLLWKLLSKVVIKCPSQFALLYGGLSVVIRDFQDTPARQLLALTLIEAQPPNSELALQLILPLLRDMSKSGALLANLEPELRRSYCCKLVNMTNYSQPPSSTENDRILEALFQLYRVYITSGITGAEPFNWLTLLHYWVTTRPCNHSESLHHFLERGIIETVFFTNLPRSLQSEFAPVLSQLANQPFSTDGEIDQRLTAALDLCLAQKQADTEVYFGCLREAMSRGRSVSTAVLPKICSLLENMSELSISESTLEGLFLVLSQAVTQGFGGAARIAQKLTTHYLFPSAENKYPFCTSAGTQQAGFDLLTEICVAAPAALGVVLKSLERFHRIRSWRKSSFKSWVVPAQEEKSLDPFVGLRNLGATCYLNSVLQQFLLLHSFRDAVTRIPQLPPGVTAEVAKLLLKLQFSAKPFVQTKGLCSVYTNWDGEPINPREQMDVEEFLGGLLTKMQEELKPIDQAEVVQRTFESSTVSTIRGLSPCSHSSEREETHFTIPIEVKNKRSVCESLATFVQKEMMEGDSAYLCEHCQRKVTAEKHQRFRTLPEVLVLSLRRFEYSVELGRRKKINDYFDFEDELDMSPYLSATEMASIHKSAHVYRLKGIIIHIGEADAGHYVALARDGSGWVQFNDTQVTVLGEKERREMSVGQQEGAFAQTSAYLLLYQKATENDLQSLHTIRRHPGSAAEEISRKNEDYLYKKSVFRPQYRNFVLRLLTKLPANEQLLRFAVSDFLTIHSRGQNTDPDLLYALYQRMLECRPVQHWFARALTSSAALQEFILDCPHLLVRKFLAALFFKAVEAAAEGLLGRLLAAVTRLEQPATEKSASVFELLYCIARCSTQQVADSELPAILVAQLMKQKVSVQSAANDAPEEWGYTAAQISSQSASEDTKPNCAFQLAILQCCLAHLRPELITQMCSKVFMQEAVFGASNKFGGIKLASIYAALSPKQPELLDQYLACLADYFQACDYDRYRVCTAQVKRLAGQRSSAEEVNKVMNMLMAALENNRGYVLASATLVRLLYKLITSQPLALLWFKTSNANRAIEAWEREYRRFSTGVPGLSLTKSPQYYQPSIYQIVPDITSVLQALTSQQFPNKEDADSDVETYELKWERGAEMLLAGSAAHVQVEKNMELLFQGTYMEAGILRKNFIATDDDRLMPEHTKIRTSF